MKISLIIPTLNSSKTISKCLISIYEMSKVPEEIIIVDGGSKDNTLELIKKFPILLYRSKQGISKQRNLGLKKSRFDLIAFLDSDVQVDKDWLSNLFDYLSNDSLYAAGGKLIETNRKSLPDKWRNSHMSQGWGNRKIINPKFLFGSNLLIKKVVFEKIGYFNEKYKTNYEDVDLFKRMKNKELNYLYSPNAKCYHLKEDNLINVMRTNYNWQYYAFHRSKNLSNLLLNLLVFNPYKLLRYLINDIFKGNILLLPIDIFMFFYHSICDIKNYFKK